MRHSLRQAPHPAHCHNQTNRDKICEVPNGGTNRNEMETPMTDTETDTETAEATDDRRMLAGWDRDDLIDEWVAQSALLQRAYLQFLSTTMRMLTTRR
jgi:hypothetical protein